MIFCIVIGIMLANVFGLAASVLSIFVLELSLMHDEIGRLEGGLLNGR